MAALITPLIYFLVLLTSLLGLGTGVMLAFLTKEELEGNRKYLVLAKKFLLGGLLGIVGFIYSGGIGAGVLFFVLGFSLGWFLHEENTMYLLLGSIFFVGSLSDELFPLVGVLIMLYGFAAGTLMVQRHIRELKKDKMIVAKSAIAPALIYLFSAGLLYLVRYLLA